MKTLFKKSLMSTALILMSAHAMAVTGDTATGVFQWSGVAPTENVNNGICIKAASGVNGVVDHSAGAITFKKSENADTYDIQSSTELAFTVMSGNDCTLDNGTTVPFTYALDNLKVGINGGQLKTQSLPTADDAGQWLIKHSKPGSPANILNGDATAGKDDVVALTVAGTDLAVAAGDSVVVQAFVLVTETAASRI